jgi:hypothetical protein
MVMHFTRSASAFLRVTRCVSLRDLASRQAVPVRGSYCDGHRWRGDSAALFGLEPAPANSLRALRPLRSDSAGEHETCALERVRPQAEQHSRSQKSPLPGTACREYKRWRASGSTSLLHSKPGPGRPQRSIARCLAFFDFAAARCSARSSLAGRCCLSVAALGRAASSSTAAKSKNARDVGATAPTSEPDALRPARPRLCARSQRKAHSAVGSCAIPTPGPLSNNDFHRAPQAAAADDMT